MAQTALSKLLNKIEKKVTAYSNNNYDAACPFYDLDDYVSYIRKELKLTKKSDIYIFDMEVPNYMDSFYTTLMGYVGKDVSIQVNQTFTTICDGDVDLIVLIVTNN